MTSIACRMTSLFSNHLHELVPPLPPRSTAGFRQRAGWSNSPLWDAAIQQVNPNF
jgi:hypothetical protein